MNDMTTETKPRPRRIGHYSDLRHALSNALSVRGCDFSDMRLPREASFYDEDFRDCIFDCTELPAYTRFVNCDLRGASFRGAVMAAQFHHCKFEGANFDNAISTHAEFRSCTGMVDAGTDWRGYRFLGVQHEGGWMIHAGCRWYTVERAIEHWEVDRDNRDAMRRVELIRQSRAQDDWKIRD